MLPSSRQNKVREEKNHCEKEDTKPHLQWNTKGKHSRFSLLQSYHHLYNIFYKHIFAFSYFHSLKS